MLNRYKISDYLILCGGLIFALGMPWGHVSGYVGMALALIGVIFNIKQTKLDRDPFHIVILIFAFTLWGLILSATIAFDKKEAFSATLKYVAHWAFPFILGYFTPRGWRKKLIVAWIASMVLVGAIAVVAYLGYTDIDQLSDEGLLKGWHTHIQFAMLLLIALHIVFAVSLTPNLSNKRTIFFVILGAYIAFLISLTGSRGIWFASGISLLLAIIFSIIWGRRRLQSLSFAFFGLIVLVISVAIFPEVRERIDRIGKDDPSYIYRKNIALMAENIIADNPIFGIGPGQTRFAKEYYERMDRIEMPVETGYLKKTHLHDIYLHILAEFGIPGLFIFIFIIISVIFALVRKMRELEGIDRGIVIGVLWGFIGLIFADILDCLFRGPPVAMEIFWLLGIALGMKREGIKLDDCRKFLLIRTDKLGDVILTTPMARAIKSKFATARVDMMVKEYPSKILLLDENIDNVIIFSDSLLENIKSISAKNYDCGIVVHPKMKPSIALWLSGTPIRVGTAYRLWSAVFFNVRVKMRRKGVLRHESNLNLELLKPFGISSDSDIEPKFSITDEIKRNTKEILKKEGYSGKKLIVFHPGTGGSAHMCPPKTMGKAGAKLKKMGFEIAITGSEKDISAIDEFTEVSGSDVINLSCKTDIILLAGVLSLANVVVASGTGPLHLASALGTPVVGIFPPSIGNGPIRWAPKGSRSKIIVPPFEQCKKCIGDKCRYYICTEKISANEIIDAVLELCDACL